ncbi:type II toxin-antitoxin system VapC family toxin [Thiotrichales bacterium 19S11-10]|nr:type II toxin-antitoxin system VapC family toxin [Thiotrichales bacterium 19S11-10]MCF6806951.1 type II toxin-antitoxin system VapC family toxin [Thiotrichales bacterium 19S9-11]MCF6810920.1 type II toxin-antitoxin system VapC family toxin [Thiotrichales bacterium 19S9-12]
MYLLDTHYLLWLLYEPSKLSKKAIELIENPACELFFSSASIFEVVIKESIGKIKVSKNLSYELESSGLIQLPIMAEHAEALRSLPTTHKDPFDRIMLAQCTCEKMTFITQDKLILKYQSFYKKIKNI